MENLNTCIRCGKPCPEGDFMCAACNEWLAQQEGLPTMEETTAEEMEVTAPETETAAPAEELPAAEAIEETAEETAEEAEESEESEEESAEESEDAEEEAEETTKRCIFCCGTIPAQAEFCPLCGKDLLEKEAPAEVEEEEERHTAPLGLVIGLGLTVLLLLGALVAMFYLVLVQERPAAPQSAPSDTGLGMFEPAEGIPTPEEIAQHEAMKEAEKAEEPEAVACRNCGVAITVADPICPFCDWDQSQDPADFVVIPLEASVTFGEELIGYTNLTPTNVTETSFLSQRTHDNVGALTVDGDLSTSWQEGATGYGIGESINYEFEDEVYVLGLALWTGNWREGAYYEQNGVPRLVNIYIGESVITVELPYTKECHYVVFNQLVPTNLIMLEVSSVYEGSMYKDTCIAEVQIVGSTEKE